MVQLITVKIDHRKSQFMIPSHQFTVFDTVRRRAFRGQSELNVWVKKQGNKRLGIDPSLGAVIEDQVNAVVANLFGGDAPLYIAIGTACFSATTLPKVDSAGSVCGPPLSASSRPPSCAPARSPASRCRCGNRRRPSTRAWRGCRRRSGRRRPCRRGRLRTARGRRS